MKQIYLVMISMDNFEWNPFKAFETEESAKAFIVEQSKKDANSEWDHHNTYQIYIIEFTPKP